MNVFFNEFINKNKKIIQNYKCKSKNFFLIDRGAGHYITLLNSCMVGAAINEKYKINPKVISDLDKNHKHINLYRSFGYSRFLNGFRYKYVLLNLPILFLSIFFFLKGIYMIKKYSFHHFIDNFNIKEIFVGDLIYDSYIRYGHRFKNPKTDLYFLNILFTSIFRTLTLYNYFEKYDPKFVIIATQSYANNHGISLKICVKKKIKVLEPYFERYDREYRLRTYDQKKIEYGYQNTFGNDFKKNVTNNKKISEKQIDTFLKKRISGNIITCFTGDRDIRYSNKHKLIWSKKKLIKYYKLSNYKFKKIILIAPHAFTDAPHCRGTIFAFRDYYSQVVETLNFINKNCSSKEVLWILRPHPTSIYEYGEEGIITKLIKDLKNPFVKLCPSNINTDNVLNLVDGVITGRGTIGLEAAIKGKKTLIAGAASYSGLGLAIQTYSKKKYFKELSELKNFSKLPKNKILLAKKTLFYFDTKKIELKESKIVTEKIRLKKKQENVFCKSFLISVNKIGFKRDPLFKDLLKVI